MWLLCPKGWIATFSRLYVCSAQRHYRPMLQLEHIIGVLAELVRAVLVDVLSERVRKLADRVKLRRRMCGMADIRQHLNYRSRARLLHRISTKTRPKRAN